MRITKNEAQNQDHIKLVICVDVSKNTLDTYINQNHTIIQDHFPNNTLKIERKLEEYHRLANELGCMGLHILAEPTGTYHRKLFRVARRLGHTTAYVNVESVSKLKVVESNDTGKTDQKDPRIIWLLSQLDKTLKHRILPEGYQLLREYNKIYDDYEVETVQIKNRMHRYVMDLFSDYSFKNDFLYSPSGQGLITLYGGNPYRIVQSGKNRFMNRMRKHRKGIHNKTLEQLWNDAETSVHHELSLKYRALIEERITELYERYLCLKERKAQCKEKMIAIYSQLRDDDPCLPLAYKGVISAFHLARFIGETGPLSDFAHVRQLLRYGGLNLRERKSGTYRGLNRMSKKGRRLLRKILGQIIFPLVKKNALFGHYYHTKKACGMISYKANVATQRKFLKMMFGWYHSNQEFDLNRVFTSESEYHLAA
ncbi:MAG: transposase [Candidatus Marinimicrobia bacterium]|nr:transposase [Candidatus Neomarinimicrobiota bacterium]